MVCAWGTVLVLQAEGTLLCLKEKALSLKLELLFGKSLYLVALNLAHSEQVGAAKPTHIVTGHDTYAHVKDVG